MDVDERVPAVASSEIEVAARPEAAWEVMAAIERWPEWNPDVRRVAFAGPLAPGGQFRWKAGPGTIVSTLRHVEPPRQLAWTGRTLGIRAVHVWELEPRGETTLVRTRESWDGLVVRLLRAPMRRTLQRALDDGLRHLKAEVERRAG